MVSVIASSVRKGNVIEKEGKLYVVLKAESFHPGKGTPTTTIDMRRIADGVKVTERYKTTESMEKAFIDELTYNYLYQDGEHYVFMDPVHFDQLHVDKEWSATGRLICRKTWKSNCRCSTAPPCPSSCRNA